MGLYNLIIVLDWILFDYNFGIFVLHIYDLFLICYKISLWGKLIQHYANYKKIVLKCV